MRFGTKLIQKEIAKTDIMPPCLKRLEMGAMGVWGYIFLSIQPFIYYMFVNYFGQKGTGDL